MMVKDGYSKFLWTLVYYKKKSLWADVPQEKNYNTLRVLLGWYRRRIETKFGLRKARYIIFSIRNHH